MENLNVVRARLMYESLQEQRDDALGHYNNCVIRHDEDAYHFWAGIIKSIEHDMKQIHINLADLYKEEQINEQSQTLA